jgi:ABC-type phosphate/phosphonate transport system substrate-binding protein
VALLSVYTPAPAGAQRGADTVRIGVVNTLFRGAHHRLMRAMMQPFKMLVQVQTGLNSELEAAGDALHLAQLLADNKLQVGVFQGVEFAWARQEYPALRPLVIAVNQATHLRACLVVPADARVDRFADLRGKRLAMPGWTHVHCELFLRRLCRQGGAAEPPGFFSRITHAGNAEDVLDDVVDGTVPACLVEEVSFNCYTRRKPARVARLKVLKRSEVFPASVIAYRVGGLDPDTLRRFREGLLDANHMALGRELLTIWKLTAIEPVPADYHETLAAVVKRYPVPEKAKSAETASRSASVGGGGGPSGR